MNTLRSFSLLFATLLVTAGLIACDSADPTVEEEPTFEVILVEDLAADPAVRIGPRGPEGTGRYTFFDLRDEEVVLASSNADRADSASTEWDIALQSTNILVNGGTSGPGEGAAYVAEAAFQEVAEVETDRLKVDDAEAGQLAVQPGSGNGWYNYADGVVTPIPGRTLVIRTADGEQYAKIRILSYYEGNPENPGESDADARYYTFEYVLSDDTTFE